MTASGTSLEELAHDLVTLSIENSIRADRLIDRMRRERRAAAERAARKTVPVEDLKDGNQS